MSPNLSRNTELVDELDNFLRRYYHEDIVTLAQHPNQKSIDVDFNDLYKYNEKITRDLLNHPQDVTEALDEALALHDTPIDTDLSRASVNIVGFSDEAFTNDVGEYGADQIGEFVPITGQVSKVSEKQPDPEKAVFSCERCGHRTVVPQLTDDWQEPYQCESCERQGPFRLLKEDSDWRDYQLVRLQQPPEQVANGVGASIDIAVYNDLCGRVNPGDRATISGPLSVVDPSESKDFAMQANSVESEDTDFDEANIKKHKEEILALANGERGNVYELLIDSVAPRILGEGYRDIKLALALQLFGGVRVRYDDDSTDRGRFHILLLGDPGTAKSELVNSVDKIAPRSVYTSGENISKAGMTAAVVPDDFGDGKWSLEAGPMVKANDGICCVDEIDKAPEDAIEGLHTALEKQVVTVSKASFSGVQMQARTGLLAAGNPTYGRFDEYEPIGEQIDLSPTLMSRFDLMFMLKDKPDPDDDEQVIRGMLDNRAEAIRAMKGEIDPDESIGATPAIDHDVLRAYIAYVHEKNPMPVVPDDLRDRITKFLVEIRSIGVEDDDHPVPVTLRSVEAIERLAEASARIRLADEVTREDVKRVLNLVMRSMDDVGRDPETGKFDADVIETGNPKSQHERRKWIGDVVKEYEKEEGGIEKDVLGDLAVQDGYGKNVVLNDVEKMENQRESDIWTEGDMVHHFL